MPTEEYQTASQSGGAALAIRSSDALDTFDSVAVEFARLQTVGNQERARGLLCAREVRLLTVFEQLQQDGVIERLDEVRVEARLA